MASLSWLWGDKFLEEKPVESLKYKDDILSLRSLKIINGRKQRARSEEISQYACSYIIPWKSAFGFSQKVLVTRGKASVVFWWVIYLNLLMIKSYRLYHVLGEQQEWFTSGKRQGRPRRSNALLWDGAGTGVQLSLRVTGQIEVRIPC